MDEHAFVIKRILDRILALELAVVDIEDQLAPPTEPPELPPVEENPSV